MGLARQLGSAGMTDVDEHGRPEPPLAADETGTLLGFLDYQRATFAWKCAGLDAAGLAATVGVSSMTLGGMLKHLALVEDSWFSEWLLGRDPAPPWDTVDWDADPRLGVAHGRRGLPGAAPRALAGQRGPRPLPRHRGAGRAAAWSSWPGAAWPDGRAPSLRWILLPHDRGVRAAQRPRRPHPGVGGRADRRVGRGPGAARKPRQITSRTGAAAGPGIRSSAAGPAGGRRR